MDGKLRCWDLGDWHQFWMGVSRMYQASTRSTKPKWSIHCWTFMLFIRVDVFLLVFSRQIDAYHIIHMAPVLSIVGLSTRECLPVLLCSTSQITPQAGSYISPKSPIKLQPKRRFAVFPALSREGLCTGSCHGTFWKSDLSTVGFLD